MKCAHFWKKIKAENCKGIAEILLLKYTHFWKIIMTENFKESAEIFIDEMCSFLENSYG